MLADVPPKLEFILQKALRKNSNERYQAIEELLLRLWAIGPERADGRIPPGHVPIDLEHVDGDPDRRVLLAG